VKYQSICATSIVKLCLVLLLSGTGFLTRAVPAGGYASGGYDAPYFQADFTENLSEWTAALVNPALLYRVNQMHFDLFNFYRWSLGNESMGYGHIGALFPIRKNHTLGLTLLTSRSTVQRTEIDGMGNKSDLGLAGFQDLWVIGNYGIRVLPWLMLGTNVKLRVQNQFGNWAVSHVPGLDLGIYLNPLDHYRFGDLGLSLCVQDLLPTQVKWEYAEHPEVTINRFRAGIRYAALNDNLVGDVEFLVDNMLGKLWESINWKSYVDMFKGEGTDSLSGLAGKIPIAYRMGAHLKYMFIPQLWIKMGWTNNNIPYLGFNYNLLYPLPEMINYLNVDANFGYSFIELLNDGGDKRDERGFTIACKVSTDFGPTREQRESKRLYDKLILAPMDAYNEAMRLYLAGKYWEAGFAFGKVISLFPNFHLNDKAKWYLGNSYRFLYMNDIARQVYKEALEEYTTSEMRSKYLYGLQSLDYREGNHEEALKNHAFVINLYGDSDIRPDADYLAGEIHFQRKNYNVAQQLLSGIAEGDPNYLYAQYTLSIINIEDNKEQAAVQNLKKIIEDTTEEVSDQLLQDAANTKLGHLYFEMGDQLRLAVEAYQRVPDGSPYQDEALLGTAWAWIKVNQPNVALQTIERLISAYPESPLVPEAFLVKGYSLMLLKKHPEAITSLEQCVAACQRPFITDEDLGKRKALYEEYSSEFAPTADLIKKNALRKPTNKTLEERPGLQKEFESYAKESKDFFKYNLLANSHKKFFMRQEEILADAEYALAKATKIVGAKKEAQIIQEQKKEEGKIDQELEKLQEQLENIEQ